MLTISQFIEKQNAEKAAEEKRLAEERVKQVSGAFKNLGMIFLNSGAWEDVKLLPRSIALVLTDEAIDLFKDSMKILGKELIAFDCGTFYKNTVGEKTINIDCDYNTGTIDDVFAKIVDELADRGDSDRTEIEKIAEHFNKTHHWL